MSETSAGGSGGAVAPGWYTDPHDPRQLRWWSGEGWTEHVSAGTPAPQAAAEAVAAAPVAAAPVAAEAVPAQQVTDPSAPLPSRRALRDPATEASEAAEAALAAQAAQQQAEQQQAAAQAAAQAQADQQAQAAAAAAAAAQQAAYAAPTPVQPVQPDQQIAYPAPVSAASAPVAAAPVDAAPFGAQPVDAQPVDAQPVDAQPSGTQTPSAPVPTLPVAPTSFLEQQGYAPLDGAPADPNAWRQPAPEAQTPPPVEPVTTNAWDQPVQPTQAADPVQSNAWNQPVDPTQTLQPVQPVQPVEPAQPVQPNAWNQPVRPVQPVQPLQPVQPVQPIEPTQPVQQGWGTPAAPVTQPAQSAGMDSLFGGAAADQVATQDAQANQWGLAPTEGDTRASRRGTEAAQVAGSSSFWAWLIAISPILAAGSIAYVLLTTKSALTDWPFEAAVAVPYLLVLLFAIGDRAVLLQLGHTAPRSPAWAFATAPIYLIQRAAETRREDGSGTLLTIVWFASFIVAIAGIVGYGLLTHHALISGLPT